MMLWSTQVWLHSTDPIGTDAKSNPVWVSETVVAANVQKSNIQFCKHANTDGYSTLTDLQAIEPSALLQSYGYSSSTMQCGPWLTASELRESLYPFRNFQIRVPPRILMKSFLRQLGIAQCTLRYQSNA